MNSCRQISRYRGVLNIVRFNWPIYALAVFLIGTLAGVAFLVTVEPRFQAVLLAVAGAAFVNMLIALLASHYIYDISPLYSYQWLDEIKIPQGGKFANIHSGFDETSLPLMNKFPAAQWTLCDFYDPTYNTEGSIRRARKLYPCLPQTLPVKHSNWMLEAASFDVIFCFFAVHEIRSLEEKVRFFEQAAGHLKSGGKLVLAEHQRDLPNFLVFGYGAFHFFSTAHWKKAISAVSRLKIAEVFKVTPYIKIFVIEKT